MHWHKIHNSRSLIMLYLSLTILLIETIHLFSFLSFVNIGKYERSIVSKIATSLLSCLILSRDTSYMSCQFITKVNKTDYKKQVIFLTN